MIGCGGSREGLLVTTFHGLGTTCPKLGRAFPWVLLALEGCYRAMLPAVDVCGVAIPWGGFATSALVNFYTLDLGPFQGDATAHQFQHFSPLWVPIDSSPPITCSHIALSFFLLDHGSRDVRHLDATTAEEIACHCWNPSLRGFRDSGGTRSSY